MKTGDTGIPKERKEETWSDREKREREREKWKEGRDRKNPQEGNRKSVIINCSIGHSCHTLYSITKKEGRLLMIDIDADTEEDECRASLV